MHVTHSPSFFNIYVTSTNSHSEVCLDPFIPPISLFLAVSMGLNHYASLSLMLYENTLKLD